MKIAIAGCTGRMGLTLMQATYESPQVTLVGGSVPKEFDIPSAEFWRGHHVAEAGKMVQTAQELVALSDGVIDFTTPEYTLELAQEAAQQGKILVTGTTGLTPAQQEKLLSYAAKTRILQASNMSIGVTLLQALVEQVARTLGEEFDIEIIEMHHNKKLDAPSGTALSLGKAAAKGREVAFEKAAVFAREGQVGARPRGEIGFATLRGGDVIGDHTVIFAGAGERIELTHKASSRAIYATGALRAALWLWNQKPGLYTMADVIRCT